ncbi:MAG: FAD-binding oxidoreductase [Rhodobacter sp.]|nr:FAD-binding oxidoreductase [Rhodobacter sp.]
MATVEITVMGAGIFGLSVAYACARRGARVHVFDPNGVAAGASGGIVGALAPHTPDQWLPKKAFQLESLLMAARHWAEVDALSGQASGYGRVGRLQPLARGERALTLALERTEGAKELWRGKAVWQVIDAGADAWQPISETGKLVHDTLSARIHPRRACDSLAAAIRALGGDIESDGAVRGAVVWATGHEGLLSLTSQMGRLIGNGVKGQAALVGHDAAGQPQIFADGIHLVPHEDGTVAIGSTSERYFDDATSTDLQLDDLLARAREICPVLRDASVLQRWAGVRPRAKSRAPMLGAWPDRPGHFIANGGFKIGFGMAPKVGEVMADLVLEGRDCIPEGFRVEDNL